QQISRLATRADRSDTAGMGVDQPRGHRCSRYQAKLRGCGGGQTAAEWRASVHDVGPDPTKGLVGQRTETDPSEISLVPAPLMGEIGPLACHLADRSRQAACGLVGQEVGQIHELLCRLKSP